MQESGVNLYEEFDSVISTLKKDRNNPYPLVYIFRPCGAICNAASIVIDSFQLIYYNPVFIQELQSAKDNMRWAVRCIIAHEIGHHLLGHTTGEGNLTFFQRRRQELQADYFAGFVIRQFPGSTLENALAGLNSLDKQTYHPENDLEEDDNSYPTLAHRMESVSDGFQEWHNSPKRISMFQKIDSLSLADLVNYGRSWTLHVIDRDFFKKNFKSANEFIETLLKTGLRPDDKKTLKLLQDQLQQKMKEPGFKINPSSNEKINQTDLNNLRNLYEKYKDGSFEDQEKAKSIQKSIQQLQKNQEQIK